VTGASRFGLAPSITGRPSAAHGRPFRLSDSDLERLIATAERLEARA